MGIQHNYSPAVRRQICQTTMGRTCSADGRQAKNAKKGIGQEIRHQQSKRKTPKEMVGDTQKMGVTEWRSLAQDRLIWRNVVESAKTRLG